MFKAIFTNSFGILFSRILGFIRDLLSASYLGANVYSDVFFVAFKFPNLFRRIFAEGAFTQTFIPAFTRSKHKGVFALYTALSFLLFIVILALFVSLFPQLAAKLIAIGFKPQEIQLAAPYVAICFWYLPLIFVTTFFASLLQYKHHFATTAFGTALLNVALIAALLLSQNATKEEIVFALSIGVVSGGILQLIAHLIAIKVKGLCPLLIGSLRAFRKKCPHITADVRRFKKEFFPAIWGNSTAQVSAFLDTWLASFLASGAISYLYYANRVFQLPLALFAIATSVAIFPKISRYLKNGDTQNASAHMQKAFWFLSFMLLFSTLAGFILANEITRILFQRGAFNANDTVATSNVLRMYMVGLLPFGLSKLFLLWLYASQKQRKAAAIASTSLISNIALSLALIAPLGASGLALASSISAFVSLFFTLKAFGFREFLGYFQTKHVAILVGSSVVLVIILYFIKEMLIRFI